MANYEATRYDFDGASITGIQGFSTGTIVPWSDTTAPSGFLECNGQAISRTTYSALFAIVGLMVGPDYEGMNATAKDNVTKPKG